ncbi:streptophobe family protein [Streptomyces adustus]|uniref:streptophobe family protein n=1 Tax=Streptomyces adustus TaxID=1609272 RepID=UPI0035DBC4CC
MSRRTPSEQTLARPGWGRAAVTVLAGLVAMGVVAALGLWAAGATELPDEAFPRVVAATVVTAVGGSVELSGNVGSLAESRAGLTATPLSVTLVGALVVGAGFLWPLRHRVVTTVAEPAWWAARIAVLWLLGLLGLALGARQTFAIPLGEGTLGDLGDLFGVEPRMGFAANVPLTLALGLLWLAVVLFLALLVSRAAPLPARLLRFQEPVRPAAYAMVVLLLSSVVVGACVALVVAATQGHPAETFAVMLLGLPNIVWIALTIGMGATWDGRVQGPFRLPLPPEGDQALRTPDGATLDLGTLTDLDGRYWWLLVGAAVLLLTAAFVLAACSPTRTRVWQLAVRTAVALVLTVLTICLLGRVSAYYGVSLLGIGDLGGNLSGVLLLRPQVWTALGLALLWGLVTGFLGGPPARRLRRAGEAPRSDLGPSP